MDRTETDDESVVGDEAHIVAKETDGPRGRGSGLTDAQRDQYQNLILLCKIHHKLVDDQPNKHMIGVLRTYKSEHEKWVKESLVGFDPKRQRDDEIYSDYVEQWAQEVDLDNWGKFTVAVLGSDAPAVSVEKFEKLKGLKKWLFARIWPGRYPSLEAAFENFRCVLNDFQYIFSRYSIVEGRFLVTEKFYKRSIKWDPALERLHDYHIDLLSDLALELTRAANYVCDHVRGELDRTFRVDSGAVIAESGPHGMDFSYYGQRAEYRDTDRSEMPYPGLEEFVEIRSRRDGHYGKGVMEGYRLKNWP